MNKKINLKHFIIFQFSIMIFIGIIYVSIVPKIKSMCGDENKCANGFDCICQDNVCHCNYYNSDGNLEKIECPYNQTNSNQ